MAQVNDKYTIPRGPWLQIAYAILLPAFFMGFCLLYDPFGIQEYYTFGSGKLGPGFHLVILTCIILLSTVASRSLLYFVFRRMKVAERFKWKHYVIWCLCEIFITACYMALYTAVFTKMPFFQCLGDCLKFGGLTLVFPYVFLMLMQVIHERDELLAARNAVGEESLIKFRDEHQRLKLTIDRSAVLCIRSDYNYLEIHYLEADKVKTFLLRNSMKSQEENAEKNGLVRCHRSYFVNPAHIKMLSKDKSGVYAAILDAPDAIKVPVSRQYYEALSSIL